MCICWLRTRPRSNVNDVAPPEPFIVTVTLMGQGSPHGVISWPSQWIAFSLRYCSAYWPTCWATWALGASTTKFGVRKEAPIEATAQTANSADQERRTIMPVGSY